jgi:hypothetical protein
MMEEPLTIKIFSADPSAPAFSYAFRTHDNIVGVHMKTPALPTRSLTIVRLRRSAKS